MTVPESEAPGVQLTLVCPDVLVGTPVTAVGAAGMPATAAVEADEAAEFPSPLVAISVKVYDVPSVSPDTVVEVVGGAPVTASPVHDGQAGVGVKV